MAGVYAYPVVVQIEVQSGTASAYACAWLDDGKAWKKQVTVRTYEASHTQTVTDTLSGQIIVNNMGECDEADHNVEYDPPLGTMTEEEWLDEAGELQTTEVTFEEEVPAADIKSAANAAIQWGSTQTSEAEFNGCLQWLLASVIETEVSASHQVDEGPGVCEIATSRVRLTRLGSSMDHIIMIASWSGGGAGGASLTNAGTTSGWFSPGPGDSISNLLFNIGPY